VTPYTIRRSLLAVIVGGLAILSGTSAALAHGGWPGWTDILLGPEVGWDIPCNDDWNHFPPNPCWHSDESEGNYWAIDWLVGAGTGVRLHTNSNVAVWVDYFRANSPCQGLQIPFWDEAGGAWIKLAEIHYLHMDPDWGNLPPTPPGELLPAGEFSRHLGTVVSWDNCPFTGPHLHQSGGQDWEQYGGDRHHISDNDWIPNPANPNEWQHNIHG